MIPITTPFLGREEADAAHSAILSGWLSQGAQVAAFETEFAAEVGAAHACAVSNCTTALHLALLSVGVGAGSEVITVSHSFVAGPNAIRQAGALPVFVDIGPEGYNIDPTLIAAAITPKTSAILSVHQIGMPCDMPAILEIAKAHGLPVIEDAACAIGSTIRIGRQWRRVGQPCGDVVCFSFHPRKVITVGEGGMLTTDCPDIDAFLRLARQHGMSVPDAVRHTSSKVTFEEYRISGFNYRMTDIQAAIGREQLKRLPEIVARRRALANRYAALISGIPGVSVPREPDWAMTNWQSYAVQIKPSLDQYAIMQRMLDDGIATRRGIMCAHLEPAYLGAEVRFPLPNSEAARANTILLPMFPQLSDDQQQRVVSALKNAVDAQRRASKLRSVKA